MYNAVQHHRSYTDLKGHRRHGIDKVSTSRPPGTQNNDRDTESALVAADERPGAVCDRGRIGAGPAF